VLVTRFDDVPYEEYVGLAAALKENGIRASLYLGTKKFGKQIDYAVRGHYSHVVIMGGDELAAGTVKVKNLAARTEDVVARDALAAYFKA
jgi:histidyl-tRNA synthetase